MKSLAIDRYRLVLPPDTPVRQSEERDAVLLTLPDEGGVVFWGVYTCKPKVSKSELFEFLGCETTRFLQECIAKVAKVSGQPITEEIEGSDFQGYQTVVALKDGRLWFFRLVGEVGAPSYALLHWNGDPKFAASHVLKVFHSLELNPTSE